MVCAGVSAILIQNAESRELAQQLSANGYDKSNRQV